MGRPRGLLAAALLLAIAGGAAARAEEKSLPGVWGGVGIEEHLGSFVPLDAKFTTDDGAPVTLHDLVRTPTILALVYFRCPNACDYLLTSMAGVIRLLPATPVRDYQVLTMTIDDRETLADARKAKKLSLESIEAPFPPEAWRFLTGSAEDIRKVADAVGFHYVRNGDEFDHPLGLVILSPQGKIVRYMTGTDFLPVDLKMSLMEASTGTVGPTIAKVMRFCFSYDPQNHKFVFNILKITASFTLLVALGLVSYLLLAGRKRRTAGRV
ncbi:MAG: SCO family protein [Spirochaetia bacterium]|jgi:protein SCO1/2